MMESLNEFFTATYAHNKAFYGIQLVAVMSLAGIGLGLAGQLLCKGWISLKNTLHPRKS